ncbi:unnamed protein product, partial [Prorocentrum cordatum]
RCGGGCGGRRAAPGRGEAGLLGPGAAAAVLQQHAAGAAAGAGARMPDPHGHGHAVARGRRDEAPGAHAPGDPAAPARREPGGGGEPFEGRWPPDRPRERGPRVLAVRGRRRPRRARQRGLPPRGGPGGGGAVAGAAARGRAAGGHGRVGHRAGPQLPIALRGGAAVSYAPLPGDAGARDRQLLALVGGGRSDGAAERLLAAARAEAAGGVAEPGAAAALARGWTVELWVRLDTNSPGELTLFSRSTGGLEGPALSWSYRAQPAGFVVRGAGRAQLVSADAGPLMEGEWTHVALRSDLSVLEVWMSHEVVGRSPPGAQLPVVPAEAALQFGPAPGLSVTEVRVWGVLRGDDELLDQQRQPLQSLLPTEKRTEAWKKVRIRAGGATPAGSPTTGGLWNLTQLAGGLGTPSAGAGRDRGGEECAFPEFPGASPSWGGSDQPWDPSADPWGAAVASFGEWAGGGEGEPWGGGVAWEGAGGAGDSPEAPATPPPEAPPPAHVPAEPARRHE